MADTTNLDSLKKDVIGGGTLPTNSSKEQAGSELIESVGTEYSSDNDPSKTSATGNSLMDVASAIMGTGTAKGAALGALFAELLKSRGSGQGVVKPIDFSTLKIPARTTTITTPKFVPYAEYGARDVPAMSSEAMRAFGAPTGLGSLMPMSSYSSKPLMSVPPEKPLTITSAGTGTSTMPKIDLTPRSNKPISPLMGALLGGALGYLVTPESAASRAGAGALRSLYNIGSGAAKDIGASLADFFTKKPTTTGGNVGPNVSTGSKGEAYYEKDGKTYAINTDGTIRLVYDPKTGEGSAGGYDPDQFGGTEPIYTLPADYTPYIPYTYTPTFSEGSEYGSYYDIAPVNNESSSYYSHGGMATPLMADGGMVPSGGAMPDDTPQSFYTYGTIVDPMQFLSGAQEVGMAHGGKPQGGLHVPTVEGRHDYRAGARVMGPGDGQSDDIPAMLADGEYVIDAETVAQLGNGSSKAGSDMLDKFREEIRAHKRSAPVNKIPPASKSPLQYLKQAQSRSKKNV